MQISSRFTIAVHMLCYIALFQDKEKVTSDIMAGSINANPVVVRRLLSQLNSAGWSQSTAAAAELFWQ